MNPPRRSLLPLRLLLVSCFLLAVGLLLPVGAWHPMRVYAQSGAALVWDFESGAVGDWQASGQVQVTSDTIDQLTDNAMHSVAQGQYSIMVGDAVPWGERGDEFSVIERTIQIPQIAKPMLQYSYAVVANDPPSHPETDKPYFQLWVRDLTTAEDLPVSAFKYTSQTNQEWFLGQPPIGTSISQSSFSQIGGDRWVFIPWKNEKVDLTGRGGHQLLINFTVRDCSQTAHAAYGYLDNIRVGPEVVQPALPALVKQPPPAGTPPDAGFLAGPLNVTEQMHLWPWCLLPLLLLPLLLLAYILTRPRAITAPTHEPSAEKRPRQPTLLKPSSRSNESRGASWRDPSNPPRSDSGEDESRRD